MFRRCFTIGKELRINEEIREKEVRVVDSDGSQLGLMSGRDALSKAAEKDLDLVLIAPNATPPVCKIMDYGKYCFEQAKREKEAKKNQKVVDIKEIRLGLKIDVHDFETKGNHAKRFLAEGSDIPRSVPMLWRGSPITAPMLQWLKSLPKWKEETCLCSLLLNRSNSCQNF